MVKNCLHQIIIDHRFTDFTDFVIASQSRLHRLEICAICVIVLTPQAIRICAICESVVNLIKFKIDQR